MIYLDSAATTPVSDRVFAAMTPWLKENYGNPGSLYSIGREARRAVEDARSKVARLFNAKPENIVFTSGGSEGNSMAFRAAAERLRDTEKKHVIVSSVEHDSVLRAAESLTKYGFHVTYLPVCSGGSVKIDVLKAAITPETGLVSVMYVNNETGSINILDDIGKLCVDNGILFHTDCVQAAGFLAIDVEKIQCDYATASAHKFHGPKGIGCIYVKELDKAEPIIYGGHAQEHGIRGGTENVASIVGMGEAADEALLSLIDTQVYLWNLKIRFWEGITKELGDTVHLNGRWLAPSKVINFRIDGVDADSVVMSMDACGMYISAGSACRSLELEPSHVLMSMGLSKGEARSSVRVSFSNMNSPEEVDAAVGCLARCVRVLRGDIGDI